MAGILPFIGPALTAIGGLASLFGQGQGKEIEYTPVSPQMDEYQKFLMETLKQRMDMPRPFAQMPDIFNQAMSMITPYYTGQEFQPPQIGWMGPQGFMGGGNLSGPGMNTPMSGPGMNMPMPGPMNNPQGGYDFRPRRQMMPGRRGMGMA